MATAVVVALFDELIESVPTVVTVAGRELVLLRWGEDVVAMRNVCPHQSESLAEGLVRPYVRGMQPGDVVIDHDDPVLVCPVHAWQFRLRDGRCPHDTRMRVATYDVRVDDGQVVIEVT